MLLFVSKSEIFNYADDITLYSANKNRQIISGLSNGFKTLIKLFCDKYMVLNLNKLGFQDQNFDFHYKNVVIRNSAEEKILGITIYSKLCFKSRIVNICIFANRKISALYRTLNYIDSD